MPPPLSPPLRSSRTPPRGKLPQSLFLLLTLAAPAAAQPTLQPFEQVIPAMGVQFRISLYADSPTSAEAAFAVCEQRILRIDNLCSDYRNDSEAMRLGIHQAGKAVEIDPELWEILRQSLQFSEATDGAFDVTIGPLTRLWRLAKRRHRIPDLEALAEARQNVGWKKIELGDPHRVTLHTSPMRLDFGGIAKGYAADQCLRLIGEMGIRSALIDASGDLAIGQPPPNAPGWSVGITPDPDADPVRQLCLSSCGVATSGDREQGWELDGVWHSHIIDPRTGTPLSKRVWVSVIARTATEADALASALSVLGPKQGIQLAEARPALAALIAQSDRGDAPDAIWTTADFPGPPNR